MAITRFTVDDNVIDTRMNQMVDEIDSAIGQNTSDLNAHKAEMVSNAFMINRDISISGVQRVSTPFKAKNITFLSLVPLTKMSSIGIFAESGGQMATYTTNDGNYRPAQVNPIVLAIDGENLAYGTINNVDATGFDITWEKTGTIVGNATVFCLVNTH